MNSKKLGELYSFLPKSKIKAGDGLGQGTYPFYTSSTLQSKWLNEHQYNTRAIILGTGGKPNLHFVDGPFSISTDCIALCSKQEEVNIEYTYHYLASQIHLIERGFKGSGLKHISKDYVANLVVTFPDLETQNKIVAILKRTDSLLAKREKTIAIYDRLLQATFWEMFKKYEGENTTKLSEVADIKSGLTMGKDYVGQVTSFVPYMRVANVQDGYLDFAEVKKIEASPDEVSRFQLEFDDLLLTEGGDHDTLGRGSLWKNQITGCIFQNHIFRVRVKEKEKINPTFLSYQTASVYGKRYFLKSAKQTTGIASINTTQLKNFPVYIPPKILQDKFASIVSRVDSIKKVLIANLN